MLIKTKQNKNGNLVCLDILSELEKQTSSQKDKHTHSKHGEGAARSREHLGTREQWGRTQPGRAERGTSCPQGEKKERMQPSMQTLTGLEGGPLCAHPPPNPRTSPPSKLIHVKLRLHSALLSYHRPLRGSGDPRLTPSGVPCRVYKSTDPNRHWDPNFTNRCWDESTPINCIFPGRLHFTTSDAIQNKKATLAGVYNNSLY